MNADKFDKQLGKKANTIGFAANALTVLIAVIALYQSHDANKVATRAFQESTNQFLKLNRPILSLQLIRFDDKLFVHSALNGTNIDHSIRFELKNIGNVGAKNITWPGGPGVQTRGSKIFTFPKLVSLQPGDDPIHISLGIRYNFTSEAGAETEFNDFVKEGSTNAVSLGFTLTYQNALDLQRSYQTSISNIVTRESAKIVDSNFGGE